jgi:hypothetical protein
MTITPDQIAKLARAHATDFALNVDIQFLMDYYIDDYVKLRNPYLKETADALEDIVDDLFCHTNQDIDATKAFLTESGIDLKDVADLLSTLN